MQVRVKMTVDMTKRQRHIVRDFPDQMGILTNTPGAEVVRALVDELEGNGDLREAIAARLRPSGRAAADLKDRREGLVAAYVSANQILVELLQIPDEDKAGPDYQHLLKVSSEACDRAREAMIRELEV
jgi:hypothetical protein